MKYFVNIGKTTHEVELVERLGKLRVKVDGEAMDLVYEEADRHGQVILLHDGASYAISIEGTSTWVGATLAGHFYSMEIEDERERAAHLAEKAAGKGGGPLKAVMPGVVVEVLVEEGETVQEGQPLLILEAMKMQNEISASGEGTVGAIHVEAGQAVAAGEKLITLKGVESSG